MFCKKCGMRLEENGTSCPYCKNDIAVVAEKKSVEMEAPERVDDTAQKEEKDLWKYVELIKCLIQEHPVRSALCIPFIIYLIPILCSFMIFINSVLSYDLNSVPHVLAIFETLKECLLIAVEFRIVQSGFWIVYGSKNYVSIRERVLGKCRDEGREKVHTVEAVVTFMVYATIKNIF